MLNNGKRWIAALREAKPLYEKAKAEAEAACPPAEAGAATSASDKMEVDEESLWPEWLVPELRRVFAEGLLVDYLKYPSDDRLTHVAMQCLSHEQDQNRYRVSTIGDKVALVNKAFGSTKDWTKARKSLLEVLGDNKTSTVHRWIVLARDLDQGVLAWIEANRPTLSQAYVVGNKYVVGRGPNWWGGWC